MIRATELERVRDAGIYAAKRFAQPSPPFHVKLYLKKADARSTWNVHQDLNDHELRSAAR